MNCNIDFYKYDNILMFIVEVFISEVIMDIIIVFVPKMCYTVLKILDMLPKLLLLGR